MRIVGLTGGIATGKSTVSKVVIDNNIPVIDADIIAREALVKGQPAHRRVVKLLGEAILDPRSGEIDRPKLASLVFRDSTARKKLNAATHPYIRLEMLRRILWAFLCFQRVVVLDTPLLYESGIDKWVHTVVVVYCPEATQKQRLIKRDGISDEAAQDRINAQMPIERKRQMAHIVIDNSTGLRETRRKVTELLPSLRSSWLSTTVSWALLAWPAAALYSLLTAIKVLKL